MGLDAAHPEIGELHARDGVGGKGGRRLGIFLAGGEIDAVRQAVRFGSGEVIFVDRQAAGAALVDDGRMDLRRRGEETEGEQHCCADSVSTKVDTLEQNL